MQAVILAGGLGTRLSEETEHIPKPMVRIGGVPILVHIMQIYAFYGHTNFLISSGYKSEVIEDYFEIKRLVTEKYGWMVSIVNTGLDSGTGGRLLGLIDKLEDNFLMTYGDGLSSVNISKLLKFHETMGLPATVTAVRPPPRFGSIRIENGLAVDFREKDSQEVGWINGGFFVLSQGILSNIVNSEVSFESSALTNLAQNQKLACFEHEGFWLPMDTLRDKKDLEKLFIENPSLWIHDMSLINDFK